MRNNSPMPQGGPSALLARTAFSDETVARFVERRVIGASYRFVSGRWRRVGTAQRAVPIGGNARGYDLLHAA